MQASHGVIVVLLLAVVWIGVASAQQGVHGNHGHDALEQTLREVTQKNVAAYGAENARETMQYVHTKSPDYQRTMDQLEVQFASLDARSELVGFRFLGHDEEFAVARYKMKTVAPKDQSFQNNMIDAIAVFHQEQGVWKLWSDHMLGVELVP